MNVLVTGATGLIGNAVAKLLAERGHAVRALVRDPTRAKALLPASIELAAGDVTDPASIARAVGGVTWVFHAAGMPEQWQKDDSVFDRVNRQGAANVFAAAREAGVKRVVHTSTMDVFAKDASGVVVEENVDASPKPTAYERSKQAAEREGDAARARGLDIVYVNPSAVYGPSPVNVALNSFFIQLLNGKAPMLPPGGMSVVFVDGAAEAHLAAAERGKSGERYLLADAHVSNAELAAAILRHAGNRDVPRTAPVWLMKALAGASAPLARTFGFTPLIAPGQLSFLLWDARVDATKAERDLGFAKTALEDGVARTIAFLRKERLVPE